MNSVFKMLFPWGSLVSALLHPVRRHADYLYSRHCHFYCHGIFEVDLTLTSDPIVILSRADRADLGYTDEYQQNLPSSSSLPPLVLTFVPPFEDEN